MLQKKYKDVYMICVCAYMFIYQIKHKKMEQNATDEHCMYSMRDNFSIIANFSVNLKLKLKTIDASLARILHSKLRHR